MRRRRSPASAFGGVCSIAVRAGDGVRAPEGLPAPEFRAGVEMGKRASWRRIIWLWRTTIPAPGAVWVKASLSPQNELGDGRFQLLAGPGGPAAGARRRALPGDAHWPRPRLDSTLRLAADRRAVGGERPGRAGASSSNRRPEFEADCGGSADMAPWPEVAEAAWSMPRHLHRRARLPAGALQDRFTFENFVVGPANEFAHAVARRVASWVDGHFNPVVFHGPYGFGKTHLLNAMAREATQPPPIRKVVYLTAERFLSGFVRALMDRRMAAFKDELRIGRPAAHRRCALHRRQAFHPGGTVPYPGRPDGRRAQGGVFGRSAAGGALTEIDARLRSHLSAGLVCGIEPADRRCASASWSASCEVLCRQQGFAGGLQARGPGLPGRPVHRQRARTGRGAQHPDRARRLARSTLLTLDEAQACFARICAAASDG